MMLPTSKRFADLLASDKKSLEIRRGRRYSRVRPGDAFEVTTRGATICALVVRSVVALQSIEELRRWITVERAQRIGLGLDELLALLTNDAALRRYKLDSPGPIYIFDVERVS